MTEIDGVPVADDGTIAFRNEERVEFAHVIRSKHIGDQSLLWSLLVMGAFLTCS